METPTCPAPFKSPDSKRRDPAAHRHQPQPQPQPRPRSNTGDQFQLFSWLPWKGSVSPLQRPPCGSDPSLQGALVLGMLGWRASATTDWRGTRVRCSLYLPECKVTASPSVTCTVAPTKPGHRGTEAPRWCHPDSIATAPATPWVPAHHCERPEGAAATTASREVAAPRHAARR